MSKLKAKDLRRLQRDQNNSDSEYLEEPIIIFKQRKQDQKKEAVKRKRIRQDKERLL